MINFTIRVARDQDIETTIREFKKRTAKHGVMLDYARSQAFTPKPEKRRKKSHNARTRISSAARRLQKYYER